MSGDPQQDFAEFLQQHPACFQLSRSRLFVHILKYLSVSPKSLTELLSENSSISSDDMLLILGAFDAAGLVEKSTSMQSDIFCVTDLGRLFLEKLENTSKSFK